ncbi:PQQ-binding-like beta-propeller repeat protein [Solwaraspora sp. WMMD937]|uniref:outer membrane protein assembly factor BamB family protein n=1 Tax=Solwaraspora sp. WMMD937 TaxID=3016090 RepID=UPI00249B4222|nr:PQQ-binding-like beta-propeller repeat protein [Solwaraspora sp. WMMD937]WFE22259.1 PQQ-binding-like beta-propeller repeat protein [Solwaraspora sp. WMMD937]
MAEPASNTQHPADAADPSAHPADGPANPDGQPYSDETQPGGRRPWWRSRPRWQLITAGVLAGVVVVAAVTVVAWRVLAPTEVVTPAGYQPSPPTAEPGPVAELSAAPLLVDGRFRVYATTRQVRADGPIDMRTQVTPAWSFRRWPEQLTGVVATGTTVVSRWTDGELVAIDAGSGKVAWRSAGPQPADTGYAGRRTGAQTVYAPSGLHTAVSGTDGRSVVVAHGESQLAGFDTATGRELWRTMLPGQGDACRDAGFSTTGGRFALVNSCAAPPTVEFYAVATGQLTATWQPEGAGPGLAVEPIGCAAARSTCGALRTTGAGQSRGWLVDGPEPVPAPPLDPVDAMLVDGMAIRLDTAGDDAAVVAEAVRTGEQAWRRPIPSAAAPGPGGTGNRLLAVQPGRAHLLTATRELITLDAATGAELSSFVLILLSELSTDWAPGYVYAQDGFVAVERLRLPVDPDADDGRYYRLQEAVIIART